MSRFWAAGESSESENESEQEVQVNRQAPTGQGRFGANYDESDSDSDGEVRVVKSQTDRALDAIREKIHKIATCRKTNNWSSLLDEFDGANKMIDSKKTVLLKTGIPKFYIKMLVDVEDYINTVLKDKEALKRMKESVQRDINRMKLAVKRHNAKYENEIKDCRENPANYVEVKEAASDDEDDDDDDEDDSDEDEDSGDDSDDDSDDDSIEDDDDDSEDDSDDGHELKGRARWLKKTVTKPSDKPDKPKVVSAPKPRKETKREDSTAASAALAAKKAWQLHSEDEIKEDAFNRRLADLLALRGRKGTDPRDMLLKLEVLAKVSRRFGPRREIQLMMHLVSAMYDSHRSIDEYMELRQWRTCARSLLRITKLLESNPSISMALTPPEDVTDLIIGPGSRKKGADVEEEAAALQDDGHGPLKVVGSLEAFILRLNEEYTKSLQQINPHTKEYVIRLSDEAVLIELAEAVFQYYLRANEPRCAAIVALLKCEHTYYKHDTVAAAVQRAHIFNKTYGNFSDIHPACAGKSISVQTSRDVRQIHPASFLGTPTVDCTVQDNAANLAQICQFIFKHGDERTKTRALLCSVYHHALHDRYYVARDLFLMSHIQDNVSRMDTGTQILYNRSLVSLGLCAFRQGLIQKAYDCLAIICSGRIKELLAQGQVQRYHDRDPEQEKLERRRQMPYHMHINPELLECCHLICAMLIELPQLARPNSASVPGSVSRTFRKYLQTYNRQLFAGPPEYVRDHVLLATKCILSGDWCKASETLVGLEVWKLVPGDGATQIRTMIATKVKDESLKTYLLTAGQHYNTLSLSHLCDMFEMDLGAVKRAICRMIFYKELAAALDLSQPGAETVSLHSLESTPLQALAQGLADKMNVLVESNERLVDPIVNVYNFPQQKDEWIRDKRHDQQGDRRKYPGQGFRGARPVPNRIYHSSKQKSGGRSNQVGGAGGGRNVWGKFNAPAKAQQAKN